MLFAGSVQWLICLPSAVVQICACWGHRNSSLNPINNLGILRTFGKPLQKPGVCKMLLALGNAKKKKRKKKTSSKSMNGRTPATSINTWPKVHFSSSLQRLFQPETADLASAWWFPTSRWLPALDEEGDVFFQVQPRDRVFGWIGLVICKKCTCKFWWSNMYTCRSKCKSVMYGYIRKA